jgi:hypothetical protein
MRSLIVALGTSAMAVGLLLGLPGPAAAKKSKMGCEIGKEVWNAKDGKCVPGKYKAKTAAKKTK